MADLSPIVHRRLRTELRRARDEAGLTQQEVADRLEWSLSKIIRIEAGNVNITTTDLRVLLQLYGLTASRVNELAEAARQARTGMWWNDHKASLSKQLIDYFGYEYASSRMLQFEPLVVPGLLQTPEYIREILSVFLSEGELDRLELHAEVRSTRQKALLGRSEPPKIDFIVDEAAVRRVVGGPQVMRAQLLRMAEVAESVPGFSLQVMPFFAGAHPGLKGPFVVMEFPEREDDDVLFIENSRGDMLGRDFQDEVVYHREIFEQLRDQALSPQDSLELLRNLAAGF
jgi:transcriptional regulator with XRE-family HTH domain